MAGACCGRIYRMEPAIAASDCNAIQKTDTGWMVPETEVVGVAPGTAVGDERSVDIDVTPPVDGACPEVWTIGARLTPDAAFATMTAGEVNLLATPGVWTDLPGTDVTLAEAGVYNLDATFRGNIAGTPPAHLYIVGRLWDVTAAAVVPWSETWVAQINQQVTAPGYSVDSTGDAHVPYTVAGPTTIRMQAGFTQAVGTADQARVLSVGTGRTRLRTTKVAD